jgi:pilus assembly protein CpaC
VSAAKKSRSYRGPNVGPLAVLLLMTLAGPARARAQEQVLPSQTITMARRFSTLVTHPAPLERVLVTDPAIIDAVPIGDAGTEVVILANALGSTSLVLWGIDGSRAAYTVKVVPNAQQVQEELQRLYPGVGVQAEAVGNRIVLTGRIEDPMLAGRVIATASSLAEGDTVVDYVEVGERSQILLQVRFAEVSRQAIQRLGSQWLRVNPENPLSDDQIGIDPNGSFTGSLPTGGATMTLSDAVNFFLFHNASNVGAFIQALRQEGAFRSLAEPNLLAFPGDSASFLAGGEFPYPFVTGAAAQTSIQFKEFGIRLNFRPDITNSGAIRLRVTPEVSQLDFARGLQVGGFVVPSLTTRRAATVVELQPGQTFAIAGLMDSQMNRSVSKIPLLGDIPILGALFRSQEVRDNQNELLVLVTPYLVSPQNTPPPVPTGEVRDWGMDRFIVPFAPPPGPPAPPAPWDTVPPGGQPR